MAKDKTVSETSGKRVPMIQVTCKGVLAWANFAPKSKGFRCTKCGQVHS